MIFYSVTITNVAYLYLQTCCCAINPQDLFLMFILLKLLSRAAVWLIKCQNVALSSTNKKHYQRVEIVIV